MKKTKASSNKLAELLFQSKVNYLLINRLLDVGKIVVVKKRDRLIEPGQICDRGFFILEGGFVSRTIDPATKKGKTVNFFMEDFHPFMSCIDSYFSGIPTNTELIAVNNSIVMVFLKDQLELLTSQFPDLNTFFSKIIIDALTDESELKKILISYSKEEVYDYLTRDCNSVVKNVPSKYIAEFMGISAEWLSKLRKQFAQ